MTKRVAIVQSNYIPWKGYFDLIGAVDEFVLYDDAQFTKNDWRHRNRIKTPAGVEWLSLPAGQDIHRRIRDVRIADSRWRRTHWRTLQANYARAPSFAAVAAWLEPLYTERDDDRLSTINRSFIERTCQALGIGTVISDSSAYPLADGRMERLLELCTATGATTYVSGPAASGYLDEAAFAARGIAVEWFDYRGYPEYPQLWGSFVHEVSVLDLLFNCGADASRFMKLGARAAAPRP